MLTISLSLLPWRCLRRWRWRCHCRCRCRWRWRQRWQLVWCVARVARVAVTAALSTCQVAQKFAVSVIRDATRRSLSLCLCLCLSAIFLCVTVTRKLKSQSRVCFALTVLFFFVIIFFEWLLSLLAYSLFLTLSLPWYNDKAQFQFACFICINRFWPLIIYRISMSTFNWHIQIKNTELCVCVCECCAHNCELIILCLVFKYAYGKQLFSINAKACCLLTSSNCRRCQGLYPQSSVAISLKRLICA